MMNFSGLYLVTSPSSRQYVGMTLSTFSKRYTEHLRHPNVNTLVGKAFRKYSTDMRMEPLVVCEDREALYDMERRAIIAFATAAPVGYNLSPGGGTHNFELMSCLCCEEKFEGRIGISKYCSNNCKSAARRISGVDLITKDCLKCGKSFISYKYYNTGHCNRTCAYAGTNRGGSVPVTIDGVFYQSLREAGRALGVSHKIIKKRHTL